MSKKNKIYWLEGVSEKGVQSLLNNENSKFSWLRRQRNRRVLVILVTMGIIVIALGSYYSGLKEELRLDGSYLLISTLFAYGSLPSMAIAWRERDI